MSQVVLNKMLIFYVKRLISTIKVWSSPICEFWNGAGTVSLMSWYVHLLIPFRFDHCQIKLAISSFVPLPFHHIYLSTGKKQITSRIVESDGQRGQKHLSNTSEHSSLLAVRLRGSHLETHITVHILKRRARSEEGSRSRPAKSQRKVKHNCPFSVQYNSTTIMLLWCTADRFSMHSSVFSSNSVLL